MLTRDKDPRRRGDELFDGQKNRQSDKQAEPTEPPTHLVVMKWGFVANYVVAITWSRMMLSHSRDLFLLLKSEIDTFIFKYFMRLYMCHLTPQLELWEYHQNSVSPINHGNPLPWKMPFASSHQSDREEAKQPRGQPLAKQELRQGKFQQYIKHQQLYCVDEPHDLDTPSISIVSCPYEVFS